MPLLLIVSKTARRLDCQLLCSVRTSQRTVSVLYRQIIAQTCVGIWVKYSVFVKTLKANPNLLTKFSRNPKHEISRKFVRWQSRCSHAVGYAHVLTGGRKKAVDNFSQIDFRKRLQVIQVSCNFPCYTPSARWATGSGGETWNEKKQTKKLEYLKEKAWLAHGLRTNSKLFIL